MKCMLSALLIFYSLPAFTQELAITVSAGNQTIKISLEDDNKDRILVLSPADFMIKGGYLTAKVLDEELSDDWTRSFTIYDEEDNEINRLADMKKDTYCTSLKNLQALLKPGKEYSLYTVALPKDPQKAMEVKIARQLVCKIKRRSD